MTTNPVASWDWTLPEGEPPMSPQEVIALLPKVFKKWTFQLEKGDSGYRHFQGRGSLWKKRRHPELKKLMKAIGLQQMWFSPTCNNSMTGPAFYVMKEDTRLEGPWTDMEVPTYIPRQYAGKEQTLRPWQKEVWESADDFQPRTINLVYDAYGNQGKTVIAALMELHGRGLDLPPINDGERLIQAACDILMAKQCRQPKCVFIDLPRAMDKRHLRGLFTAIEQIKKGKVYDTRYSYKEWWFDAPQIWVFTNIPPNLAYLSRDRWNLYQIVNEALADFVPFVPVTTINSTAEGSVTGAAA